MENKNIVAITLYSPIVLYKADTQEYLTSDKGILVVWYNDNTKSTLDLTLNQDTSNDVTIEYSLIKGKTKIKEIYSEKKKEVIKYDK